MPWLTDLADVCRAAGLDVVEVPGWKQRGYSGRPMGAIGGVIAHHTATAASARGDIPTLGVLQKGHGNLPGPLCQLGLSRSGVVYVVAAGLANHAGRSDRPAFENSRAIGIEAEHPGGSAPWPENQFDAYVRLCAALCRHYGVEVRGHKETAVPKGRKTDPNFNMDNFRRRVAAVNLTAAPAVVSVSGGYAVQSVQEAAAALGGDLGPDGVDGVDGPATHQAVITAQQALGVSVDGVWGHQTQEAWMTTLDSIAAQLDSISTRIDHLVHKADRSNAALGRMEAKHGPGLVSLVESQVETTDIGEVAK